MKKTLIILSLVCLFVLGIVFSDVIMDAINSLFNEEIFTTTTTLEKKLEEKEQEIAELLKKQKQKEDSLKRLVKEINSKDYFALTKDALLTSTATAEDKDNKILLKPALNEMYLQPAASDDDTVKEIKKGLNNKLKVMLGVSKGILREKIVKLNLELVKMNNALKMKNQELGEKLKEVEDYKSELEKNESYIRELEGLKSDLEKTVGDLETKIEGGRLKVNFKGDILFSSGSHKLRKEGLNLLESVYPVLEKGGENYDIFIAGHTDNVPIKKEARDKYKSNWELSTYRAIEVVRYLTGKGMNPQNLTAAGYGEFKPIAENSTDAGKAKNRRVELFLIPKIIKRVDNH